nr:transposase [Phytoactinopolyspora halophila]
MLTTLTQSRWPLVRAKKLRVLAEAPALKSLRMVIDRRDELTRQRVQTVNRLQRLLAELIPGTAKKDITAGQAKAMLASVRPRDVVGKTRRRIAADELADLIAVEKKIKTLTKNLNAMVEASGSTLTTLPGVGAIVAARVLAEVGDVTRFANRNRFRLLDRHRPAGGLLWRASPPPALARRQPADESHAAHRSHDPDPARHIRPRLLPT